MRTRIRRLWLKFEAARNRASILECVRDDSHAAWGCADPVLSRSKGFGARQKLSALRSALQNLSEFPGAACGRAGRPEALAGFQDESDAGSPFADLFERNTFETESPSG
jgi:hypothetical protein